MQINGITQLGGRGPQKPGDPQPHLYGGTQGPQKPGDPQPHLNNSNSTENQTNSLQDLIQMLIQMMNGEGGPQKEGDPQPHLLFSSLA